MDCNLDRTMCAAWYCRRVHADVSFVSKDKLRFSRVRDLLQECLALLVGARLVQGRIVCAFTSGILELCVDEHETADFQNASEHCYQDSTHKSKLDHGLALTATNNYCLTSTAHFDHPSTARSTVSMDKRAG